MITLIIGPKGSGKTKEFLNRIETEVRTAKGSVVCIEKGSVSTYTVNHKVRLVDTDEFNIKGYEELYGLISGLFASNYDIQDVFVDATFRIGGRNIADFSVFLQKIKHFAKKHNVSFVFTLSCEYGSIPIDLLSGCTVKRV